MPGNGEEFGPCPHCGQLHAGDVLLCPNTEKLLPLEGRILDGKFRFTRQLGEGGMGAVFQADNILVKKTVAIKVMHVQFSRDEGVLARFRNEATAAGRIGSKFICDILDLGKSQLGPYIVMEMLKGHDFAAFVQKNAPVDYGTVVMVMRQALEGLEAAHAAGIVHRDLKPENIFLHQPEPGHLLVKLMDFGISKFTEGNDAGKTGMGVLMGTPEYMSPEQTEGAAQVDHRTDIWAMGVILYWALTGKNPFMGPTMAATLMNVSMREAPPLQQLAPNVPPQLVAIVEKCIRKHPEERWNSCTELRAALEPFEDLHGRFFVPYASRAGVSAPTRTPPPGGTVASTGMPPGMMPSAHPQPSHPQQSSGMQFQGAAPAGPTFSNELSGVPSQGQPTLSGGFSGANLDDDYGRPQSNMGGGIGGIIAIAVVAIALVGGAGYLIWAQTQQEDRIAEVASPPEKSDEGGEVKEEPVADKADVAAKADVAEVKEGKLDAGVAGAEGAAEAGAAEAGAEEAGAEAGAAEAGAEEAGAEEAGAEEAGAEEAGAEDDGGADAGGDGGSTPSAKKGSSSSGAKKTGGGSGGAAKKTGGDTSGDSKGGGDKSGSDKAGTSKTLTPAGKRPPRDEKDGGAAGGGKKQGKKKKKGKKAATE